MAEYDLPAGPAELFDAIRQPSEPGVAKSSPELTVFRTP